MKTEMVLKNLSSLTKKIYSNEDTLLRDIFFIAGGQLLGMAEIFLMSGILGKHPFSFLGIAVGGMLGQAMSVNPIFSMPFEFLKIKFLGIPELNFNEFSEVIRSFHEIFTLNLLNPDNEHDRERILEIIERDHPAAQNILLKLGAHEEDLYRKEEKEAREAGIAKEHKEARKSLQWLVAKKVNEYRLSNLNDEDIENEHPIDELIRRSTRFARKST